MYYVYAHTKPNGEIFYIGKGVGRRAYSKKSRNQHWYNVVAKHGFNSIILADNLTEEQAFKEEILLIAHFVKFKTLTNKTTGGEGTAGHVVSESTKEILRQHALKNGAVERCKWMANDLEIRTKRILATTGKKRTENSKQKMSKAKKEVMRSFKVCGIEFESIKQFSKLTNSYSTTVRRWLNENKFDKLEARYYASLS